MLTTPPFRLVPREEIWPGQIPTSSDGTVRPPLRRPATYVTVHYTGSPGDWDDFGDTTAEAKALQVYAQHAKKSWEYNWIIDSEGNVVEYAGFYRAAHSAGKNEISHGVLLLLGIDEPVTDAMILAFRQLMFWLKQNGHFGFHTEIRGHKDMPDAATVCPNSKVLARWGELTTPWLPEPTPPPPPPPTKEVAMIAIDYYGPSWIAFVTTGTHLSHVKDGHADQVLRAAGVGRVTVTKAQLAGLLRSTTKTSAPPPELADDLKALW